MTSLTDSLKSFASAMEVSTTNPCANDLTPEEYEEYSSISKGGFTTSDPIRKRFYRLMAAGKERKRQEAIEAAAEEIEQKILEEIGEKLEPLRKDVDELLYPPLPPICFSFTLVTISVLVLLTLIYLMELHRTRSLSNSTELVLYRDRCYA